jgi:hypothetical protein
MRLRTNIVAGPRQGTNSPLRPTVAFFNGFVLKGVTPPAAQRRKAQICIKPGEPGA